MKQARELYPTYAEEFDENGNFYGPSDYSPILESFGEILIQVDDSDYQGDSRLIIKSGDKLGYLQFGWGSCSGCDSLQACETLDNIDEEIKNIYEAIQWYDTWEDLLKYFNEHDWEGDYSCHSDEQKKFIEEVKSYKP